MPDINGTINRINNENTDKELPYTTRSKIVTGVLLFATIILTAISVTPWVTIKHNQFLILLPPLIIVFTICSIIVVFLSSILSYKKFKLAIIPLVIVTLFNGDLILNSPNNNDDIKGNNRINTFTLNAEYGKANAQEIMGAIRKHHSDVIFLVEITQSKIKELDSLGLKNIAPYRSSGFNEGNGAQGSIIMSKYKLTDITAPHDNFYFQTPAAVVHAPNGDILTRAIHIFPPMGSDVDKWSGEMATVNTWYKDNKNKYDRIILSGDYNATYSYKYFRDSFRGTLDAYPVLHYRRPTWPADKLLPFADLDHILTRGFSIEKSNIIHIGDTDHEALTSELRY